MQFSTMIAAAAAVLTTGVAAQAVSNGTVWTTTIVTAYTTYCPEPTTFAFKNVTYTVTSATTLTITNCPCTISYCTPGPTTTTLPPKTLPPVTVVPGCSTCVAAPGCTTCSVVPGTTLPAPVTTVVQPAPTTNLVGTSAVTTGPKAPPSPTTSRTLATAGANQLGAAGAVLGAVAAAAAYVL